MSSITPPSFIDDGESITRRHSHRLHPRDVAKWICSDSSDASAYTGSFMDDGADLLFPSHQIPWFGPSNPGCYESKKEEKSKQIWSDDIQRAISGDVQRSLTKIKNLGSLGIKKGSGDEDKEEKRDTVTVPLPPKWGTFVIKAQDGRVIVVDEEGEFDSGPGGSEKKEPERWIRAGSVASESSTSESTSQPWSKSSSFQIGRRSNEPSNSKHQTRGHSNRHRKWHNKQSPSLSTEILALVAEPDSEADWYPLGKDVPPPTGFFMTGGASGWPQTNSMASSTLTKSDTTSPGLSKQSKWPTPPQLLMNRGLVSKQTLLRRNIGEVSEAEGSHYSYISNNSQQSYKTGKSHKSSSMLNLDNYSTKMHYEVPTVEDIPNTSSEESDDSAGTVRCGSGSGQGEENWGSSSRAMNNGSWADRQAPSKDGWNGSNRESEVSWDGFEKFKTISEVSVAGSGSDGSLLGSQASNHDGRKMSTHPSQQSHGSQNSPRIKTGQTAWEGSQASPHSWTSQAAQIGSNGWGNDYDVEKRSIVRRNGSAANKPKYANGSDEDDETSLNENRGRIQVRVRHSKESADAWR